MNRHCWSIIFGASCCRYDYYKNATSTSKLGWLDNVSRDVKMGPFRAVLMDVMSHFFQPISYNVQQE